MKMTRRMAPKSEETLTLYELIISVKKPIDLIQVYFEFLALGVLGFWGG